MDDRGVTNMSIQLEIPDSIVQAIHLPLVEQKQQLLVELAVALYARGALSFGKATELAGMSRYEFGLLLGKRNVPRHYSAEDLQDDIDYARR
jgi:predicted HTH domain antitoxin